MNYIKRLILLVILLILAFAFFLRYDQGPVQTSEATKYYFIKDKWAGQNWVKIYGVYQGVVYAGDMRPYISDNAIKLRTDKLLNDTEWLKTNSRYNSSAAAQNQLRREAHSKRNTLTWIWGILVSITFLLLLLTFKPKKTVPLPDNIE